MVHLNAIRLFFSSYFYIHTYHNGVFVPVAFCLLSNKNKDSYIYIAIWEILRDKRPLLNKLLWPKTIVINFNKANSFKCKRYIS